MSVALAHRLNNANFKAPMFLYYYCVGNRPIFKSVLCFWTSQRVIIFEKCNN
jgi:hypothetical protein